MSCPTDYLKLLGIDRWYLKTPANHNANNTQNNTQNNTLFQHLRICIADCTACDLYKTRQQTVFGSGNEKADIMFIGEAPGAEEDKQGKPFVGRAGQLLTKMIEAIGLVREEVFIANILKCRPPNNRDPLPAEVAQCTPFLRQQIAYVKPKLLIALGRIAAHFLLDTQATLSSLRGKIFYFNEIPLIVTYHPAYLLRAPQEKAKAFQDLKQIYHYL